MSDKAINVLVNGLVKYIPDGLVHNPWGGDVNIPMGDNEQGNYFRKAALLLSHLDRDAKYILVGEAPSYAGALWSGIAFTAEQQLLDGVVPGVSLGSRITLKKNPWAERSGTTVWSLLHKLGIADKTVTWNAFPFHPYKAVGDHLSNRPPTNAELDVGASYLMMLKQLYPDAQFFAVGRKAQKSLDNLGIDRCYVRHPSMGGTKRFIEMMEYALKLRVAA